MKVACLYFPAPLPLETLRALAEACLRLSSQVALRGEEAVFVETGGSRLLFGDASLQARLQALGRRFQDPTGRLPGRGARSAERFRLGWGAHAGEALAQAKHAPSGEPLERWPLEALECYASPFFEDEEIARHMRALVAALRSLGVQDLGAFLALPTGGWGERFGPNAAVLRERLEGRMTVGWPRFEPATRLSETQDLRDIETQSSGLDDAALRFHLKRLCDRVAARLRGRGLRAAGLALELGFEKVRGLLDVAPWSLALNLALPVAEPTELRKLMQERLEGEARKHPLPRAIQSLGMAVTATAPGFHPQRDAFDRREEEEEARDGLLARLAQRLGEKRVFYAELVPRHNPERAWKRGLLSAQGDAAARQRAQASAGNVSRAPRPTRLLKRPLMLARAGDWLLYWGGAGTAKRWQALDWRGPERIAVEWWQTPLKDAGAPDSRDYWRVGTAEGGDLWVFCRQGEEARAGALWLQGWWA